MRFKAFILSVGIPDRYSSHTFLKKSKEFQFSKSKIYFTKLHTETIYTLFPAQSCSFTNKANYKLEKIFDSNDCKKWQIEIGTNSECYSYLGLNWWNKIKCNIIHKRYWIQREFDWIYKTIISTLFGAIIGIVASHHGFNEGYEAGLKAKKSNTQDTTQLPKR